MGTVLVQWIDSWLRNIVEHCEEKPEKCEFTRPTVKIEWTEEPPEVIGRVTGREEEEEEEDICDIWEVVCNIKVSYEKTATILLIVIIIWQCTDSLNVFELNTDLNWKLQSELKKIRKKPNASHCVFIKKRYVSIQNQYFCFHFRLNQ